jgi:hypothetical protein
MSRRLLVAAVVLAALTAGCLGSVDAAEIPSESMPSSWSEKSTENKGVAGGLVTLKIRDYGPAGNDFSGATIATMNDFPVLDERDQVLPRAIERVEKQRNVTFTNPTSMKVNLTNLNQQAPAEEYDVEDAGGPAKALVITPDCEDFVIAAGFGTTIGDQYDDAKSAVKGVVC